MRQLTPRQKEILELIQDFINEYGMPPTRADIARELGFKSPNAAEEHLRALQKKGVLDLTGCFARHSTERFSARATGFAAGRSGCCGQPDACRGTYRNTLPD